MKSMTGYSSKKFDLEQSMVTIDIRSVNNRYLDLFVRLPKEFCQHEDNIKKLVSSKIKRGKVSLFINIENSGKLPFRIIPNTALASEYSKAIEQIYTELNMGSKVNLADFPGIILESLDKKEDVESIETFWKQLESCIIDTVESFDEFRKIEGKFLLEEITRNLNLTTELLNKVEEASRDLIPKYRENLTKKIKELIGDAVVSEDRILSEAAICAEKADVSEEITRLKSHIETFRQMIKKDEPIGKKMDFMIQEMNREINTIGSKTNDISVSEVVVNMKYEIEKVREQLQNVE